MEKYNYKDIEKRWQDEWSKSGVYKTEDSSSKPKQFILDMFPYPSGEGLHVGHPRGYIATDVYSRVKRMQGYNVLHPMGWDAFGLPAENFAIKNKVHPRVAVEKNVARFKEQLSLIGFDYDWSREINTTDPGFYKWTQWIFLKMFERGLAYESFEPINWCPSCQTGLANEDVESDGTCERCGTKVEQKPMRQWVLKITEYADRMLVDLDKLPKWPEGVKEAQKNWIGRKEGAEIMFGDVKIFTTRPDTIFGATFVAIAGEKDKFTGRFVKNPATGEDIPVWEAEYVLSDFGTGAIMGVPAHDERDYEFAKKYDLAIRQVVQPVFYDPNFPFREDKEIVPRHAATVILENSKGEIGILYWKGEHWNGKEPVNFIVGGIEDGETIEDAVRREVKEETGYEDIEEIKVFPFTVKSYFFAAHKDVNREATLQYMYVKLKSDKKMGVSDEEKRNHDFVWKNKKDVLNVLTVKESRMMYEFFINGNNSYEGEGVLVDSGDFSGMDSKEVREKITAKYGTPKVTYRIKDWVFSRQRYWGEPIPIIHCEKCGVVPVSENDLPVLLPEVENYEPTGTGESPLANISDWVNTKCPNCGGLAKRETNTMPQWAGSSWYYLRYIDPKNPETLVDKSKEREFMPVDVYVGGDHATRHLIYARFWHKFLYDIGAVSTEEPFPRLEFLGFILAEDGRKMSKRWKNVINPDEMVDRFGADAFRLYEMFIGPFENTVPWSTDGLVGTYRFLERVWKLAVTNVFTEHASSEKTLHKTIKKVSEDIESFKFNTAVSSLMICLNEFEKTGVSNKDFKIFLQILAPFAPHIAEEIWHSFGESSSIHLSSWPKFDPEKIKEEEMVIVVQVNGKVRGEVILPTEAGEEEAKVSALGLDNVKKHIDGKDTKKVVYVKGRLINIVV